MEDKRIIELYFARDERAIEETKASYGRLILSVAMNILHSGPDSEECENDTYLRAWNSIPPTRPTFFSAYLSKITRNLAINRLREGGRRMPVSQELIVEELAEGIPAGDGDTAEMLEIRDVLNDFLESLGKTKRQIFLKRYFYMKEIKVIAREMLITESSVKVSLYRTRKELRDHLESRGIVI